MDLLSDLSSLWFEIEIWGRERTLKITFHGGISKDFHIPHFGWNGMEVIVSVPNYDSLSFDGWWVINCCWFNEPKFTRWRFCIQFITFDGARVHDLWRSRNNINPTHHQNARPWHHLIFGGRTRICGFILCSRLCSQLPLCPVLIMKYLPLSPQQSDVVLRNPSLTTFSTCGNSRNINVDHQIHEINNYKPGPP